MLAPSFLQSFRLLRGSALLSRLSLSNERSSKSPGAVEDVLSAP